MKNLITTFTKHFLGTFAFLLVGTNTASAQSQLARAVAWFWSTEASPAARIRIAKPNKYKSRCLTMVGQHVATLHEGALQANTKHTFSFDAKGLTSGTYFIQAIGADFSETRIATFLK
ncbi:MAG TPA: hypothetical protein PLO56_07325 [Rhodothermales bacterium]|nr:hypothetical protein [Rhodothermales bacterium]